MADIDTAFVKQFGTNITMLVQQRGSRLRSAVMLKTGIKGEQAYVDQLGSTTAVRRTTRHEDTNIVTPAHARRRITMYDWEHGTLLDNEDELKTLIDPTSSYVQNGAWALGRAMDSEILTQALGTAYSGKEGGTSVSFAAANQIANGGSGLTVAKLITAKKLLDASDVDEEEPRFIAIRAAQMADLLNTTEVKSADYNTVRALVQGTIDTFLGFKFIRTQLVPLDSGSTYRRVIAWAKSGLCLAVAADIRSSIDRRPDKSNAWQVLSKMGIGAARLEEEKIIEIGCVES